MEIETPKIEKCSICEKITQDAKNMNIDFSFDCVENFEELCQNYNKIN